MPKKYLKKLAIKNYLNKKLATNISELIRSINNKLFRLTYFKSVVENYIKKLIQDYIFYRMNNLNASRGVSSVLAFDTQQVAGNFIQRD